MNDIALWQTLAVLGWVIALSAWVGLIVWAVMVWDGGPPRAPEPDTFNPWKLASSSPRPITGLIMDMSCECIRHDVPNGPVYLPEIALRILGEAIERELGTDKPDPFTGGDQRINRDPRKEVIFAGMRFLPGFDPVTRVGDLDSWVDDCAFMVRNADTGQEWRIYQDGQIEGWPKGIPLVVFNRIPRLIDEAAQLGYSEAESLKDIPEAGEDWFKKAELKDGRKQKG